MQHSRPIGLVSADGVTALADYHGVAKGKLMRVSRIRKAAGAALIVAALVASVASGEENNATRVDENGESSGGDTEAFAVGDTVALGDWQIVVHGVTDPLVPTNGFLAPSEGNRWVAVDVEVTNNSDAAEGLSSLLCFELQDSENRSYQMTITGEGGASTPDGEVDAGGSRRGSITYEVPAAAAGLQLRFKCDLFSSGSAVINLGGAPAPAASTPTTAATL